MTKAVDDRNVVEPVAKYNCDLHSIYLFPILCFFPPLLVSPLASLTFQYIYVRISHILTFSPPLLHYLLNKLAFFLPLSTFINETSVRLINLRQKKKRYSLPTKLSPHRSIFSFVWCAISE